MRPSQLRHVRTVPLALWIVVLLAGGLLVTAPAASASHVQLAVTPIEDSNPVGTTHTLAATVTPAVAGQLVRFDISAGPNEGVSRVAATNASGQATLPYDGDAEVFNPGETACSRIRCAVGVLSGLIDPRHRR